MHGPKARRPGFKFVCEIRFIMSTACSYARSYFYKFEEEIAAEQVYKGFHLRFDILNILQIK